MKILTVKNLLTGAAMLPLLSGTAFALSLSDPNVVGTVIDGSPASVAAETVYVQNLLDIVGGGLEQVIDSGSPIGSHTYHTGLTDFAGTVSGGIATSVGDNPSLADLTVPAGYDFVIAKYGNGNNANGGDVVIFLHDLSLVLPAAESNVFGDNIAHGLSGFTVFNGTDLTVNGNPIPPEGTLPDGGATMLLLGSGISALAFLRRKLS